MLEGLSLTQHIPDIPNSSSASRQTQTPTEWGKLLSSFWKRKPHFCHLFCRGNKRETVGGQAIPSSWSYLRNGEVRREWRHRASVGLSAPQSLWVCFSGWCSWRAEHLLANIPVPGNGRQHDTHVSQWCGVTLSLNTLVSYCLRMKINTSGLTSAVATL